MEGTARSKLLGMQLKRLRLASGLAAKTVAASLDCEESRVYAVEGGYRKLSQAELSWLVGDLYNRPDLKEKMEARRKLVAQGIQRAVDGVGIYTEFEMEASRILSFTVELIPGLFQTEDYSNLLHSQAGKTAEEVEVYTKVRMMRQSRLLSENPPMVDSVITESSLHRALRTPGQLEKLLQWSYNPQVTIRVVPMDQGVHNVLVAGFAILCFEDDLPCVMFMDTATPHSVFLTDESIVSRAAQNRTALDELALSPELTRKLVCDIGGITDDRA